MKLRRIEFEFEANDSIDDDADYCDIYNVVTDYDVTNFKDKRYLIDAIRLTRIGAQQSVRLSSCPLNFEDRMKVYAKAQNKIEEELCSTNC